jgi:transcriptional antiterminator
MATDREIENDIRKLDEMFRNGDTASTTDEELAMYRAKAAQWQLDENVSSYNYNNSNELQQTPELALA